MMTEQELEQETILRDRFAMVALNALIVRDGVPATPEAQANVAYHYADLMLVERARMFQREEDIGQRQRARAERKREDKNHGE